MPQISPELLGEVKRSGRHDDFMDCPFCGDTKGHLGVHRVKGIFHCFRCNASGKLKDLGFNLKEFNKIVQSKLLPQTVFNFLGPIFLPEGYKRITRGTLAFSYLQRRDVSERDIIHYQLGYCTKGLFAHRIIIPIFIRGILKYFVGRTYIGANPKYMNSAAPRESVIFKTYSGMVDKAVLVEGPFDALQVNKEYPAMALLGKVLSRGQIEAIKQGAKKIIIMLDSDAKVDAFKIYKQLSNIMPTKLVFIPEKDPGELTVTQLKEVMK